MIDLIYPSVVKKPYLNIILTIASVMVMWFNDARLLDEPLLNQTHATKNILVFHNSHLNGQQIKGSYKFALNHSEKVEKYLILTEKQKKILLAKLH